MHKRLLGMLLAVLLTAALCLPARAVELELSAPSAILMEKSTGEILYEQNSHEKLPPASVTKVMTLLLVMEALEDGRIAWDDTVTTSAAAAAKGGSQIYLEENEQLPLTEMLKAVVVASANDCACALAEHIAGSESAFAAMMNARAEALGMTDTHFVNCTGLDDGADAAEHRTTAYDIALMSRELLRHEEIKKYTTIWMDTVRNGQFGLANTNKLVRFYDGTTGLKTGFTAAAGYCLAASAERGGMELIAVVMHCDTSAHRFEAAKAMLRLFELCAGAAAGRRADPVRPGCPRPCGGRHARPARGKAGSDRQIACRPAFLGGLGRSGRHRAGRKMAAPRHAHHARRRRRHRRAAARRAGGCRKAHMVGRFPPPAARRVHGLETIFWHVLQKSA